MNSDATRHARRAGEPDASPADDQADAAVQAEFAQRDERIRSMAAELVQLRAAVDALAAMVEERATLPTTTDAAAAGASRSSSPTRTEPIADAPSTTPWTSRLEPLDRRSLLRGGTVAAGILAGGAAASAFTGPAAAAADPSGVGPVPPYGSATHALSAAQVLTGYVPRVESTGQGGVNSVWRAVSQGGVSHSIIWDDSQVPVGNTGPVPDPVLFIGANIAGSGSLDDLSKGGAWLAIEGNYRTNTSFDQQWHNQNEIHLEMSAPGSLHHRRVFSSSQNWSSGETDTSMHGDSFAISSGTGQSVINWGKDTRIFVHRSMDVQATALNVGLVDGAHDAYLRLFRTGAGAGGVSFLTERGDIWKLHSDGDERLQVLDFWNERAAVIHDPGAAGSSAARTSIDTRLRVQRGAADQTDNIIEVTDETGTVLSAFDHTGDLQLTGGLHIGARGPAAPARTDHHVAGDQVEDANGDLWLCVGTGTPGTWRKLAGPATAGALHVLDTTTRVYDSRPDAHPVDIGTKTRFADGETRILDATANNSNVPADAVAVMINATATNTNPGGYFSFWKNGTAWPGTSSLNWSLPDSTVATTTVVAVGPGATFQTRMLGAGGADLVVDLIGYYR